MPDYSCNSLTFSNEDPDRYESSGDAQNPLSTAEGAAAAERKSLSRLLSLIKEFAPHLHRSFVYSEAWWEQRLGTPEAHVRSTKKPTVFSSFILTLLQMFMFLLFRGIQDILVIFNSSPAAPVPEVRDLLNEANAEAAVVWNDEDLPFPARWVACTEILQGVVKQNETFTAGNFEGVPEATVERLSKIFRRHYPQEKFLLMGCADEEAYEVQEGYAREVARLLGTKSKSFESRATTRLGKAYGRTALPLLCMSSVSALWKVCQSPFYKSQISLVSSVCSHVSLLTDSRPSSTSGSNRLQSRRACTGLGATTSPPSVGFSGRKKK